MQLQKYRDCGEGKGRLEMMTVLLGCHYNSILNIFNNELLRKSVFNKPWQSKCIA